MSDYTILGYRDPVELSKKFICDGEGLSDDYLLAWIEDEDRKTVDIQIENSQSLWEGMPFDRTLVMLSPQKARELAAYLVMLADEVERAKE